MLLGIAGDANRHLRLLAAMYLVEVHHFVATELYTEPGPAWDRTLDGFAARGIDVVILNVHTENGGAVVRRHAGHLLYLSPWAKVARTLTLPPGDVELVPGNSPLDLYAQLDSIVGNVAFSGTVQ